MALFIGRVVGTKMQKTAKVEVTRMFLHPQVLKVKWFSPSDRKDGLSLTYAGAALSGDASTCTYMTVH